MRFVVKCLTILKKSKEKGKEKKRWYVSYRIVSVRMVCKDEKGKKEQNSYKPYFRRAAVQTLNCFSRNLIIPVGYCAKSDVKDGGSSNFKSLSPRVSSRNHLRSVRKTPRPSLGCQLSSFKK